MLGGISKILFDAFPVEIANASDCESACHRSRRRFVSASTGMCLPPKNPQAPIPGRASCGFRRERTDRLPATRCQSNPASETDRSAGQDQEVGRPPLPRFPLGAAPGVATQLQYHLLNTSSQPAEGL